VFVIHKHKKKLGTEICASQNTYHLYVFVIHKDKINFGITPVFLVDMSYVDMTYSGALFQVLLPSSRVMLCGKHQQ
jgi:hypothetical protein